MTRTIPGKTLLKPCSRLASSGIHLLQKIHKSAQPHLFSAPSQFGLLPQKSPLYSSPSWFSLVVSPTLWRLFPLPLFSVFCLKLFFSLPPCAMWPPDFLAAVVLNHMHDPCQRNPFLPFLLHDPWWPPSL